MVFVNFVLVVDLVAFFAAFVRFFFCWFAKFVDDKADCHRHDKQNPHLKQGFLGNHGEHDEGFVARRGNHHGDQRTESQQLVRIHRHGGKTAHAARDEAQARAQDDLSERPLAQLVEPLSVRIEVDVFEQQHHDNHQAGN